MADDARMRVLETALRMIARHLNEADPSFGPDVNRRLDAQIDAILDRNSMSEIEREAAISFYKLASATTPLAWLARLPGCVPNKVFSSRRWSARLSRGPVPRPGGW